MDVRECSAEPVDFAQLFTQHAPFAWRVLKRFGVAESDLPDACQEVFLVVHRKLHEFEGRSTLRTWLYRICARVASDYRKRAHRRYETEPLIGEPAVVGDQLRTAELAQICALVEVALDGLDDDKRQVFVLYELEDMAMTEIAALMDCPLKTAFSRLYVARDRVNAALRRAGCAGLMLALDPLPLRATAQAPLVSALKATGGAAPSAAQLGAVQLGMLASTSAATPSFALPALFSGGALAVAAALVLSVASGNPDPSSASVSTLQAQANLTASLVEPQVQVAAPTQALAVEVDPAPIALTSAAVSASTSSRPHRPKRALAAPPVLARSSIAQPVEVAVAAPWVASPWIEAPSATTPLPSAAASPPSAGLDEVLSATSIRALMRVGPTSRGASDGPSRPQWALLPESPNPPR